MSGKLTYKESGVDTREAAALVGDIGTHVRRTQQQRKLHGAFGLFAAAFDLSEYKQPVIVTGCDGVGTKLEVQLEHGQYGGAGKDLVAMSVNDILTTGGDPLMFLDYIGIAALDKPMITELIAGMCDYLESCGCILAGPRRLWFRWTTRQRMEPYPSCTRRKSKPFHKRRNRFTPRPYPPLS